MRIKHLKNSPMTIENHASCRSDQQPVAALACASTWKSSLIKSGTPTPMIYLKSLRKYLKMIQPKKEKSHYCERVAAKSNTRAWTVGFLVMKRRVHPSVPEVLDEKEIRIPFRSNKKTREVDVFWRRHTSCNWWFLTGRFILLCELMQKKCT